MISSLNLVRFILKYKTSENWTLFPDVQMSKNVAAKFQRVKTFCIITEELSIWALGHAWEWLQAFRVSFYTHLSSAVFNNVHI